MANKEIQMKLNMDNIDEIKYFVAFSYLNVKPILKSKLLEYFDFDAKRAWLANKEELAIFSEKENVNITKSYLNQKSKINVEEAYKNAISDKNVKILTCKDEKYPSLLKQIPDFPIVLFYKGDLEGIDYNFNLAVVGSRQASTSAKLALNSIISSFKNTNVTIVSGLAYGIDAQAHKSAIENNLKTIAVIGSGLDITYPVQNKDLYEKIENGNGVIFSEYPLGTRPVPTNFPQRNRIVVGMSKGTLVAEAQLKSGAMISANLTLDYNRELMCMPGNILNPNTQGIYHLIKQGAGIAISAQDILNQMNWDFVMQEDETTNFELNDTQKNILEILAIEAKSFDEIINEVKVDVAELMVILTELEIKGLIVQQNNKYYKSK